MEGGRGTLEDSLGLFLLEVHLLDPDAESSVPQPAPLRASLLGAPGLRPGAPGRTEAGARAI